MASSHCAATEPSAQPERVGLAVVERVGAGHRLRVGERVVGLLLRRARRRDRDVDGRARGSPRAARSSGRWPAADAEPPSRDRRALRPFVVDDDLAADGGRDV